MRGHAGDAAPEPRRSGVGADDEIPADRAGIYRPEPDPALGDPFEVIDGPDGPSLRWRGRAIALEALGDGRFLARDPDLDRYALRFEPAERPILAWHGPARFVRDGAVAPPLPAPPRALAAIAGHYRSHVPWTTNFRVILRGDVPWLLFPAAPDGFDDEQPLVPRADGSFRVGEDPRGPEDLRFDTDVNGRPIRAWLSGVPYYRVD